MSKKVDMAMAVLLMILVTGSMLVMGVLIGAYGFEAFFKGTIDYLNDPFAYKWMIVGAWISGGIAITILEMAIDWKKVLYEEEA